MRIAMMAMTTSSSMSVNAWRNRRIGSSHKLPDRLGKSRKRRKQSVCQHRTSWARVIFDDLLRHELLAGQSLRRDDENVISHLLRIENEWSGAKSCFDSQAPVSRLLL